MCIIHCTLLINTVVIVLKQNISEEDKVNLKSFLEKHKFRVNEIKGEENTIFGAVGHLSIDPREVELIHGVAQVIPISKPYKMASREFKKDNTVIEIPNNRGQIIRIGGNRFTTIAGPCAVENKEQIFEVARRVAAAGAVMLRGGAYKPRTSPYAFQGMGAEGVKILKEAGEKYGLPVATEIVSADYIPEMIDYIDVYQIGARNMQNFELLKKVGALGKPVILKRGLSATIDEWLMAAEYLLSSGTDNVILCERGIRTYETATRNTLDISAIPVVQALTHLPVIVDPSHAIGIRDKVPPLALAAVASGADGIIVEVHCNPEKAFSDGAQSLYPEQFEKLMRDVDVLAPVVGRETIRIREKEVIADTKETTENNGEKIRCAFSGSMGAYAEQAGLRYFDNAAQMVPYTNFRKALHAVQDGQVDCAVIPIENSLAGSVYENYDNLIRFADIHIVGSIKLRIEHSLLVCKGASLDSIKTVYSHPQGLSQCSRFLEENSSWELVDCDSTSLAAQTVLKKNSLDCAAIASVKAAKDLEVLKSGIEDDPRNYTRFLIVQATNDAMSNKQIPSIAEENGGTFMATIAFIAKNESGSLHECLGVLKEMNLNMSRLESRPVQGQPWQYIFYVDIELTNDGKNIAKNECEDLIHKTLDKLNRAADKVHFLGMYAQSN